MAPPTRKILYHIYDDPGFAGLGPNQPLMKYVPGVSKPSEVERKDFYCLKKDLAHLRKLGAAKGIVNPSIVSIGTTADNNEILAIQIGKGKHHVLVTGAHHAREWISVEIPYLLAEYLIEAYPTSLASATAKQRRIYHLLENRTVLIVPMVNPDGHMYTIERNRGWRTNRQVYTYEKATTIHAPQIHGGSRDITVPAGASYCGVDPNRNYATKNWGHETYIRGARATSADPRDCGEGKAAVTGTWCGPYAHFALESAAIAAQIAARNFRASISYHSFQQLLLYPDAAASDEFVQFVGRGMAALINLNDKAIKYEYKAAKSLYETTGSLMDYCYEKCPGRPTYTPEVRPTMSEAHLGFSALPEDQIYPCFRENLAAVLALINCAGHDASSRDNVTIAQWFPLVGGKTVQVATLCWWAFRDWEP